ncbi:MAG: flagellar export chaperone FliS [Magnetococcales bacterium]|nr:flagellar export chaperone FliS [Magnetococcales bacterium]|tara:strand:- start:172525 stop:172989 length:465 start_codon:yes stop_codon:yes gene_type:complete
MNEPKNAAKEYLERQVQSASPVERVVLAYDGAIRFLLAARRAIDEGNIEVRFKNNKKAADIISYLMETLDMEQGGEVAERLQRLYFYMLRKLVEVDVKNSTEAIDDVIGHLKKLRASWEQLSRGGGASAQPAPKGEAGSADTDERAPVRISATA